MSESARGLSRVWPAFTRLVAAIGVGVLLSTSGCGRLLPRQVVVPKGEPEERAKAQAEEKPFVVEVHKRPLPDLASSAALPKVLDYAFSSSAMLEMAYRDWRAAIERIPLASALPNAKLDFEFMLRDLKSIKAMLGQDLMAPGKQDAMAEKALAEAQAAGERFVAAKFTLQKRVVQAYAELGLNEAMLALNAEIQRLWRRSEDTIKHRFHVMAGEMDNSLADLRKIGIEIKMAESEQRALEIMRKGLAADLNGMLTRPPDAPLGKVEFPALEPPKEPDAALFARAVEHNPELAALRKEVAARGAAEVMAKLEKRPDVMLGAGVEPMTMIMPGGMAKNVLSPMLSLGLSLPTNRPKIRAMIAEALQMREAAAAKLRGASSDTQARVAMALAGYRDAERMIKDYREQITPFAEKLLDTQVKTYGTGGGNLLDLLDTQRMLVDLRKMVLRAEADRLRYLAELEDAMGEDLFHFIPGQAEKR